MGYRVQVFMETTTHRGQSPEGVCDPQRMETMSSGPSMVTATHRGHSLGAWGFHGDHSYRGQSPVLIRTHWGQSQDLSDFMGTVTHWGLRMMGGNTQRLWDFNGATTQQGVELRDLGSSMGSQPIGG